jgi:excisionase family DNA binding protein
MQLFWRKEVRMDEDRYWTPKQIADRLQVDVHTINRWIREGKLKAIRLGKQYRIPDSEIRAFIERSTREET